MATNKQSKPEAGIVLIFRVGVDSVQKRKIQSEILVAQNSSIFFNLSVWDKYPHNKCQPSVSATQILSTNLKLVL